MGVQKKEEIRAGYTAHLDGIVLENICPLRPWDSKLLSFTQIKGVPPVLCHIWMTLQKWEDACTGYWRDKHVTWLCYTSSEENKLFDIKHTQEVYAGKEMHHHVVTQHLVKCWKWEYRQARSENDSVRTRLFAGSWPRPASSAVCRQGTE